MKNELIKKDEASDIFAVERQRESIEGIIGNVMQAFGGSDVYKTLEETYIYSNLDSPYLRQGFDSLQEAKAYFLK